MVKTKYSIVINAPKEKVWDTMLEPKTYQEWTEPFSPGSSYRGSWDKGSKIIFTDAEGKGGMVSRIADNQLHEFISIEHIGIIQDGKEITEGPEVAKWAPAFENYTFTEKDGGTEVLVEMDLNEENVEMFAEMWPKALAKLKEVAER